jgi:hypothetical protein
MMIRMRARNLILFGAGFALLVLICGIIPGCHYVPLGNAGHARATSAPFVRSLFPEANGTIYYQPKIGPPGEVILWQDAFDGATLLIPGADTNVLLCLYDFDTCVLLLRIDTAKPFKPLPSTSRINNILFTSTWEIENGSAADWQEVVGYLQESSSWDFRSHRLPTSPGFRAEGPKELLRYMSYPGMRQE